MLELLEDMTTGTTEETKAFMAVCVETVKSPNYEFFFHLIFKHKFLLQVRRYPPEDQVTPVFIFERLCNIIFPEEVDTGEFLMTLEKDPQQEDFLQVTMRYNF